MKVNYYKEIEELNCRLLAQIPLKNPLDGRLETHRHIYDGFLIVIEPLSRALLGEPLAPRTKDGKFRVISLRGFIKDILRGYPPYFHLLREWNLGELTLKSLESKEHLEGLIRYIESSEGKDIEFQRKALYLAQLAIDEGGFNTIDDYLQGSEAIPSLLINYISLLRRKSKKATCLPKQEMLELLDSSYLSQSPTKSILKKPL